MLSYFLNCRKNTQSKNLEVVKAKNVNIMLLSKCSVCNNKKFKFVYPNQSGIFLALSNLWCDERAPLP